MQAYKLPATLNESIYFDYVPVPTFAGHLNRHPFRVVITSSNDNPHFVLLDSKFSKSYLPQENKSKWSFLRPEVRFLGLDGNEINKIKTTDSKIYQNPNGTLNSVSGFYMGVSGYAEFYFVDDIYNYDLYINDEKYSTIVAVLQTSGVDYFDIKESEHILSSDYSNSQAIAYQPHVFHYRHPDYIKISENGIRNFINPRWAASNQHVVFTFNWKEFPFELYDGNNITPIKNGFNKSIPSNTNKDSIMIDSYSNDIKLYYDAPIYLNYLDKNRYLSPGYNKTFFNVGTAAKNINIKAVSTFESPVLRGNLYSPKLWLSNPNAGLMSLVEYNSPSTFGLSAKFLQKASIYNFEVPTPKTPNYRKNSSVYEDMFDTSGSHNINSIAVLPAPFFQAWAIDTDLNSLYKINSHGIILSSINLLDIYKQHSDIFPTPLVNDQLSPTSIVVDGDQNLWITLYDNKYVLNLDYQGKFIYGLDLTSSILDLIPPEINKEWYEANESYPYNEEDVQELIEPTVLDTDSENNIWVTYSNYASGFLIKFDKNNHNLKTISYPSKTCPQDVIIDNKDNVWVALSNNIWRSLGGIEKRDTFGNLLSSFKPIMGVNELTLDNDQNLWISYSYSRIGFIDTITGDVQTFNILDNTDLSKYAQKDLTIPNTNTDETAIEGLACDLKGYLYVINSVENRIYVYNTKTKKYVDKFYVNPQGFTFWNPKGISIGLDGEYKDETVIEFNPWNKSLQAHGDWIGTRWLNKYEYKTKTVTKTISGESIPLDFLRIDSTSLKPQFSFLASTFYKYIETNNLKKIKVQPKGIAETNVISSDLEFFKINENFDLANYIKSFAFTPTLQNSEFLLNKFLPSIYGYYPYEHQDLGITSYEKIKNFVLNNSDVDVCEVKSFYELSKSVNNSLDDNYNFVYPSDIKKLMDVLSINPCRIFGSVNKNQNNFTSADSNGDYNRGHLLSINYNVSAGTPVILKTKSLNKYELIQTGPIDFTSIYSLSELVKLLRLDDDNFVWQNFYEFYEFVPTKSSVYSDNIIDWNNPQTTISNNISSIFQWVGDEQYIDSIFSYKLYKGLGIF